MDKLKINLPKQVNEIIKVLQEHGYEAYAVGGCVRDSALGRNPMIILWKVWNGRKRLHFQG